MDGDASAAAPGASVGASASPTAAGDATLYHDNNTAHVVGPLTAFLMLAFVTYVARIYTRAFHYHNLWIDDALMTLAMAMAISSWALVLAGQLRTAGKHMIFLDPSDLTFAMKLSVINLFLWFWAVVFVKVSVCLMLIRIKKSKKWKVGVAVMTVVLVATAIVNTVGASIQCRPFEANWNFALRAQGAECWSADKTLLTIYPPSSIYIATDFACALLPVAFIYKVKRPLREKIILAAVMGLGIVASVCGLVKIFLLVHALKQNASDPLWQNANAAILAYSELYLGIAAANIPCLKALLERLFTKLGGHLTSFNSRVKGVATRSNTGNGTYNSTLGSKLDRTSTPSGQWPLKQNQSESDHSDADEMVLTEISRGEQRVKAPYIMKETAVTWSTRQS